jgi:molybdate transport system regulatory protein
MADSKRFPYLQLRVKFSATDMFGPGKAELLEHISATGSISASARQMRMSYKRAWQLTDAMNRYFRAPLVTTAAGGARGGGAAVTPTGARVLAAYRSLQRGALAAAERDLATLKRLAVKPPRKL